MLIDEPPNFPNECCPNQKSCTCFDWDNITIPITQYGALMAAAEVLLNCDQKYSLCHIDAEQANAGTKAIAALREARIGSEKSAA